MFKIVKASKYNELRYEAAELKKRCNRQSDELESIKNDLVPRYENLYKRLEEILAEAVKLDSWITGDLVKVIVTFPTALTEKAKGSKDAEMHVTNAILNEIAKQLK